MVVPATKHEIRWSLSTETEVVWGLGVTEGGIEDGDEIGLSKYGD